MDDIKKNEEIVNVSAEVVKDTVIEIQEQNKLQQIMTKKIFSEASSEMSEALNSMENHGTPINSKQLAGITLLQILANKRKKPSLYNAIILAVTEGRNMMTLPELFLEVIEKVTKGDMLRGNIRANNLFKGEQK